MARKKKLSFEQMLKNLEDIVAQQNIINGQQRSKTNINIPKRNSNRKVVFG